VRVDVDAPFALSDQEARILQKEGLALYDEQPRTLLRVTKAAQKLEQAAATLQDRFDLQWQAAQSLAYLAEHEERKEFRMEAAKRGIVCARRARDLDPARVEGHYWYALNVGLLADADRSYGLNAVSEMYAALKRSIELDERYDGAGPLRILGILHLRTPSPPTSIGSARKGLQMLQRAVAFYPDYPENYLYLAEAYRENRRYQEARETAEKVVNAAPWPDRMMESSLWKIEAEKLLTNLPN